MAITKNAKKAVRSSARKRVYNIRTKVKLHDAVKEFRGHALKGNAKEAEATLSKAYKALDKAAKKGVIKKNTASRKKARLAAALKKASTK
jgi:small subunit ribosomal protein S20